ncbi:hypothetical protein Ddc_20164 [Ditylenchus destructor]|nr:hypothetical protein Ddc_20164 [Ditylenchus destructor]
MDFKRPLPIAIAVSLATAGALCGWWALNPVGDAVRLAARAEAVAAVHAVQEAADSEIEPAASSAIRASTPRAKPRQSSAELFAAAATSSDPYALAVKLRNSKTPGGFAVAARLASLCRISYMKSQSMKSFADAMTTTPRGRGAPAANAGLSPDVLSKRTSASQEVEARCRPFIDDRDISQPLADDEFGVGVPGCRKEHHQEPAERGRNRAGDEHARGAGDAVAGLGPAVAEGRAVRLLRGQAGGRAVGRRVQTGHGAGVRACHRAGAGW